MASDPLSSLPESTESPSSSSSPPRSSRSLWLAALAGALVASVLSWAIAETLVNRFKPPPGYNPMAPDPSSEGPSRALVKNAALAYGTQGASLGLILGLAGGLSRRSIRASAVAGLIGLILGGVLCAGASFGLFPSYFKHVDLNSPDLTLPLLTHAGVWSLLGVAGGLAFGLGRGGGLAMVARALAGGLIGAIVGAGLYELVGAFAFSLGGTSQPVASLASARCFAHVSVDLLAALGIVLALSMKPRTVKTP